MVRDNLTGARGRVVRTTREGVVVNRSNTPGIADTRHFTWREAYSEFSAGHRRLEVVK
jgi:hypothetical protein